MCVTNTAFRRAQPISLAPTQEGCPSGLTQRLMGTFQLTTTAKPQVFSEEQMQLALAPTVAASRASEKSRPKRRRKPQKPGKTAKMNDRHFVVHNYHDHANDSEDIQVQEEEEQDEHSRRKGGVAVAFPVKLHAILDQVERDGLGDVISWQGHGRCFVIHKPKEFVNTVMPKYFRQTKLTSFQRQLNLYGFCRLTRGPDAGGYYHELFLRGRVFLCKRMIRTKVKGTKFKAASSPEQEPDFYTMPAVSVTPEQSPHTSPQHSSQQWEEESRDATQMMLPSVQNNELFGMFNPVVQQRQQFLLSQYEPFPVQQQYFQLPVMNSYEQVASLPYSANAADQILDEAVDELFLDCRSNGLAADMNDLDDFVRDWEPNHQISRSLDNDLALGFMLDKLLEE